MTKGNLLFRTKILHYSQTKIARLGNVSIYMHSNKHEEIWNKLDLRLPFISTSHTEIVVQSST